MNPKKLLTTGIFIFVLSFAVITYLYLNNYINNKIFYSLVLAGALTGLNFTAAVYSIKISLKRDVKSSLNTYLIGMGIRIPVFLTLLIISMLSLDINHNSLIFSVLIFYIYFLIVEIMFLNILKK